MMDIKALYYKGVLLNIHRGNYRGKVSNAKPLFLIALIDLIGDGTVIANNIQFSGELKLAFKKVSQVYEPETKPTLLEKPFFHMGREVFYSIKYKDGVEPPERAQTPSAKFLRESVEYAYLDEQLWDLLQEAEVREEFKRAIIGFYLKKD